jgi:molybdate transport system substrate-binding protein
MAENAGAPDLRIMCALVVRTPFDAAVLPAYALKGRRAQVFWAPTTTIVKRLAEGESADVVVLTSEALDTLAAAGTVDPASRVEVVHSSIGLAVPRGAARPDISTLERFQEALVNARSIAISKGGASGIHFLALIERLGIAEAILAKATVIPEGFTAEKLVSGEADLAVQQISELMVVEGIDIVGPLPPAAQKVTSFSAAAMAGTPAMAEAKAFLASLSSPEAVAAYRKFGLEPAGV